MHSATSFNISKFNISQILRLCNTYCVDFFGVNWYYNRKIGLFGVQYEEIGLKKQNTAGKPLLAASAV